MASKNIIVTGIGGNVGQGIIRNIRSMPYQVKIIGTNIADFSSGNHLCDVFYKVPYAYDQDYIAMITRIVENEKVDLIIPSTDYEAFYLSANSSSIPCTIAVSDVETAKIFLDKYQTWIHHEKNSIPFAKSCLPSEYKNNFSEFILKPREGRGSRGIVLNPSSIEGYSDHEYMVQELHRGEEITTAFYVKKNRSLHGMITMSRTLDNGMTNSCRVTTRYDESILPILEKMVASFDIKGSANLQSIATGDGKIVPFEVNCRISGTNSIRSNFGFKDVQYTLQEFLYNQEPDVPVITEGVAVRVLMDVIYPGQTDFENLKDNTTRNYIF